MTKGKPFETNLNRPTWMVQLWFQWYFFKLWVPNLEFPKGVAPTRIMADVSPTNHFTFSYLYFFRVCRTPENLEWGALVLRSLEVMNKVACKPVALNFECIPFFSTKWETKWSKKYGGDLLEAHDRLFGHLSIKSYPKPSKLETQGNTEKGAEILVIQEAAAEVARQGVGSSHVEGKAGDVSELFGDSEDEVEPTVETRAP
ncbi:hypothetical protein ACFX15_006615 [Malus domestica]